MTKWFVIALAACALHLAPLGAPPAHAQPAAGVLDEVPTEPEIKNKPAVKKLVAKHAVSLQWIEIKQKGVVKIWQDAGYLRVRGEQRDPASGNFVTVDGWITKVEVG